MTFGNAKQRLPELFQLISQNDSLVDQILGESPVDLQMYRMVKARKAELLRAAEVFIKRQRG